MDMIAMLNGFGMGPPAGRDQASQAAAKSVEKRAEQALVVAIQKIKAMDDATLLAAAQAALNNQPFGDSKAEQIAAVAPQIYAEVVARFGPGKLMELAPKPEAAVAATVQATTAKAATGMSPVTAGVVGAVAGAGLLWLFLKSRR